MSGIIANAKYKGYYVGNKVKVIDMFTKKQKFLPPEEWVIFKDETGEIVPAIVDEELWEKANQILQRRSDDVKNRKDTVGFALIVMHASNLLSHYHKLVSLTFLATVLAVIRRTTLINELKRSTAAP